MPYLVILALLVASPQARNPATIHFNASHRPTVATLTPATVTQNPLFLNQAEFVVIKVFIYKDLQEFYVSFWKLWLTYPVIHLHYR